VRNAFKGSIVYELPFGRGRQFVNNNTMADAVIGGWQVSSTIVLQTGQFFTPVLSVDNSYSLAGSSFAWYPNQIGNPRPANRNVNQWFNEAAFAAPAAGTFGTEGRNQLTGPGLSRVNLSLGKTFAIWEQVRLQIRADANNIFNHPSFGLPANQLTVNSSGTINTGTSTINSVTVPSRTMQLGARVTF
jgi:hypothetical protein